jgi:hypothetical protein
MICDQVSSEITGILWTEVRIGFARRDAFNHRVKPLRDGAGFRTTSEIRLAQLRAPSSYRTATGL